MITPVRRLVGTGGKHAPPPPATTPPGWAAGRTPLHLTRCAPQRGLDPGRIGFEMRCVPSATWSPSPPVDGALISRLPTQQATIDHPNGAECAARSNRVIHPIRPSEPGRPTRVAGWRPELECRSDIDGDSRHRTKPRSSAPRRPPGTTGTARPSTFKLPARRKAPAAGRSTSPKSALAEVNSAMRWAPYSAHRPAAPPELLHHAPGPGGWWETMIGPRAGLSGALAFRPEWWRGMPHGHSDLRYGGGAGEGTRTLDLLITNQLLWPTELRQRTPAG
jgi:hypothetical protein